MYHKYIKRFFDIILSLCCIIVSSPILLVTALLVRIKLGSPVIFKQERPGYHNEIFTLYKFRSMTDAVDENGDLLPDKERLPRFGQMLRSTSLDELPEFFNILFGHMSFVGPRPLLKQYIDFYSARQKRRADVRPGLTGLAQVNGRNAISWEEKFEFDLEYVDNISFLIDIKIILKTVTKVLKREGISAGTRCKQAAKRSEFRSGGSTGSTGVSGSLQKECKKAVCGDPFYRKGQDWGYLCSYPAGFKNRGLSV